MAVMLRTLGIPSRVVNGFRSDEFNDLTGNYVVRAKDAHSWVEAYFPGYGWQTFDPTPAGGAARPQGWGRIGLYFDAMSSFWREWVVSYDSSHQYVLGRTAVVRSRTLWESTREWARVHYESMLQWARRSQDRVEHSPRGWAVFGAAVTVLLMLLGNLGRIVHWLHESWLQAHPERSPEQAAAMWYHRMARELARRGVKKPVAQTSQEFLKKIEDNRLREPVARFTRFTSPLVLEIPPKMHSACPSCTRKSKLRRAAVERLPFMAAGSLAFKRFCHPERSRFFRRSEEPALSEAEGISRLAGPMRKPNCTTAPFSKLLLVFSQDAKIERLHACKRPHC